MSYFQDAISLLVEVLLGLFLIAVICRFLFQSLRVDFRNPIVGSVIHVTNPVLGVFRRFIPGLYGFDLALGCLILVVAFLKYFLLFTLAGYDVQVLGMLIYALGKSINITCWILLIAIFGSAILSWIAPRSFHPAAKVLEDVSAPVLLPFRRLMPNLGGLDISPIFAILGISLVQRLVVEPMLDLSRSLM